jgi:hypothetical protein
LPSIQLQHRPECQILKCLNDSHFDCLCSSLMAAPNPVNTPNFFHKSARKKIFMFEKLGLRCGNFIMILYQQSAVNYALYNNSFSKGLRSLSTSRHYPESAIRRLSRLEDTPPALACSQHTVPATDLSARIPHAVRLLCLDFHSQA